MKYEFFIGARFLRSKKGQAFISLISFLSIAGVTVGVMALIVVIGVMAGTEIELKKRLLERQPHILIMNYSGPFKDYSRIVNQVQDMPEVVSAAPFVHSPVMLRSASGMKGAYLKGIRPPKNQSGYAETDPEYLIQNIEKKDSFNDEGTVSIIIGKPLAEQLEVKKGDSLGVMAFSENREASSARLPSMQRVKVFAIFDSGLYQLDKNFVGMHLEDALGLLGKSGEVTGVEVRVKDVLKSEEIARKISAIVDFPYWARDWTKANQNIFSSIHLQKTVMFIILTLIVLVAGFSITSSLMMMVMEKTKDISILMAMGASRRSIRKIFIFKGMVIGLTGTSLGMIFGFGICALLAWYPIIELPEEIYYFSRLPVHLTGVDVLIITASALLICFLSTIYPAQKASRLVPVEGIRKGM